MRAENKVTDLINMTGPATGPATMENRKAGRLGKIVMIGAAVFFLLTVMGYALDMAAFWWTTAGIFIALITVGGMFMFEGEHQRQRRDSASGESFTRDQRL